MNLFFPNVLLENCLPDLPITDILEDKAISHSLSDFSFSKDASAYDDNTFFQDNTRDDDEDNENENENETESEKGRRMGCFLCLITMMMDEMRNMGVYIMITFV